MYGDVVEEAKGDAVFVFCPFAGGFSGYGVDAVVFGEGLAAGGEVDVIAEHGVVEAGIGAHVADDGGAGVDADAGFHIQDVFWPVTVVFLPFVAQFDLFELYAAGGAASGEGVVFDGYGGAEHGDDGIACVFIEGTFFVLDDGGHFGEVFVHELDEGAGT